MNADRAFELVRLAERAAMRLGYREQEGTVPRPTLRGQAHEITEFGEAVECGEFRELREWIKRHAIG